jgi:hypothetical protein
MHKTIWMLSLCILIFGLVACAPSQTPTPMPTPTPKPLSPVQVGEKKWIESGITDYEMDIEYLTLGNDITVHLVVINNSITDFRCAVGPMFPQFQRQCVFNNGKPEFLTIPELFRSALYKESQIEQNKISPIPNFHRPEIIVDTEYGYPTYVGWQTPEAGHWNVTSFKKR